MRRPRPKTISSLAPELLKESLPRILLSYQDKTYDEPPPCPACGSEKRAKHDKRRRLYATVILDNRFEDVWVWVKRYRCRECGRVYASRAPFYPGCLYGRLVTETCLYLSSANPFCRVEGVLQQCGLQIDRDTVRNYAHRFRARARDMAGIRIDQACVGVNLVKLLYGVADVEGLGERMPGEVFQDVADETYPAVKGAKKRLRDENTERSLRGEAEKRYPQSHTLAACWEARHGFFVSILVASTAFNTMLADALTRPARGCVGSVRDGSKCYRGEHIQCTNHKARRQIARDPEYRRIKKQATSRKDLQDHCLRYYRSVRQEEAERAAQAYPELVENGVFTGALSTNSMEGGNWRIKYGLRVPYTDPASIEARTILLAITDSVKTYKAGRPQTSFAHTHTSFTYARIMSASTTTRPTPTPTSGDTQTQAPASRPSPSPSQHDHTEKFQAWLTEAIDRTQEPR